MFPKEINIMLRVEVREKEVGSESEQVSGNGQGSSGLSDVTRSPEAFAGSARQGLSEQPNRQDVASSSDISVAPPDSVGLERQRKEDTLGPEHYFTPKFEVADDKIEVKYVVPVYDKKGNVSEWRTETEKLVLLNTGGDKSQGKDSFAMMPELKQRSQYAPKFEIVKDETLNVEWKYLMNEKGKMYQNTFIRKYDLDSIICFHTRENKPLLETRENSQQNEKLKNVNSEIEEHKEETNEEITKTIMRQEHGNLDGTNEHIDRSNNEVNENKEKAIERFKQIANDAIDRLNGYRENLMESMGKRIDTTWRSMKEKMRDLVNQSIERLQKVARPMGDAWSRFAEKVKEIAKRMNVIGRLAETNRQIDVLKAQLEETQISLNEASEVLSMVHSSVEGVIREMDAFFAAQTREVDRSYTEIGRSGSGTGAGGRIGSREALMREVARERQQPRVEDRLMHEEEIQPLESHSEVLSDL